MELNFDLDYFSFNFIFVLPDSLLLLPPPVSEAMQFLTMTGRKPW